MATTKKQLDELWKQPDAALPNPEVKAMYNQLALQVREDLHRRGANVFDEMLAERATFLYAHIRQRESMAGSTGAAFANDRARKETLQLWTQMVEQLQRRWSKEDAIEAAEKTKALLFSAVNKALMDMDPIIAAQFRETLAEAMETAGI
jgi:hypothetical protein